MSTRTSVAQVSRIALLVLCPMALALSGCGGGGSHAATTTVGEVGGQTATTGTTSTTAATTSGTATSTSASGSAPPSTGAPASVKGGTSGQGADVHSTAGGGGGGGKSGASVGQGRHPVGRGGSHSTDASHQSSGSPAGGAATGTSTGSAATPPTPNANTGVPYEVTTTSMQPSFKPFTKVYYDPTRTTPQIGEVVLFFLPVGATEGACGNVEGGGEACREPPSSALTHTISMKRVVGLPGETIAMREGIVIRNGQLVSEPYATGCSGAGCEYSKPITVPAGSYYVLSDNRELYEEDSRVFGAVPQAAIAGTVEGG